MFSRFPWHVWVLTLFFPIMLVPAPAGAQAVATSFNELRLKGEARGTI